MKKPKISTIVYIILLLLTLYIFYLLYTSINDEGIQLNVFEYTSETIPQESNGMDLQIVEADDLSDCINLGFINHRVYYYHANEKIIKEELTKQNYLINWYDIQTNDLKDYHIEGYFAYLKYEHTVELIPHYVKNECDIILKEEFDNKDMLPYTIQYLDDYMQNYLEEPLAKTRYAGFISDDKIFTFVDMKYHKVLKTEKEQSLNIYACYVRTTDKKNQLKSVDINAHSSYMSAVEKYPTQNEDTKELDIYDYYSYMKKIDLGGKVKIRKLPESLNEDQHAYRFSSNADTYAGIIQFKEVGEKDETWKFDGSIQWNFKDDVFKLNLILE